MEQENVIFTSYCLSVSTDVKLLLKSAYKIQKVYKGVAAYMMNQKEGELKF